MEPHKKEVKTTNSKTIKKLLSASVIKKNNRVDTEQIFT